MFQAVVIWYNDLSKGVQFVLCLKYCLVMLPASQVGHIVLVFTTIALPLRSYFQKWTILFFIHRCLNVLLHKVVLIHYPHFEEYSIKFNVNCTETEDCGFKFHEGQQFSFFSLNIINIYLRLCFKRNGKVFN